MQGVHSEPLVARLGVWRGRGDAPDIYARWRFQQLTWTELAAPVSGSVGQAHYKALCRLNRNAVGSRQGGHLSERTR